MSDKPVTGLIQFMEARPAETERAAKAAKDVWPVAALAVLDDPEYAAWYPVTVAAAAHITLHDPARVLREVAAKRARLALMIEATEEMDKRLADDDASVADQAMAIGRARAATVAVKHDAAIWSGHPDYRTQAWKPGA